MLSKVDLAAAVGFDLRAALRNIEQVRPGVPVLQLSARSEAGVDAWIAYIAGRAKQKRLAAFQNAATRQEEMNSPTCIE